MTAAGAGDSRSAPDPLRDAFEQKRAEIDAMPPGERAARAASALVEGTEQFRAEAARLRTAVIARWKEAEGLSLQQLADRLGVERATVQKILEREARLEAARERRRRRRHDAGA